MKLARLELSGFKSFADYTEFLFDDGITSIVGPNGCGKSNVVDAVKWVLGEMSAKSLRGDAMLDVIFNGASTRKPMGMAEVSLTFTNDDRKLPLDCDSVKVTRRLYRDATSEYLINNQIVRLKDIRELFLDTGVGVDAYSLIEQGRVAALLDANSVDRREIFEEAAGISRFKQRKKDPLRKLERTDQNLAQSQLVLDEVEKQLRSVKVQAGRARSYQEYAARLRELRAAYVLQEYEGLHRKVVAVNEQLGEAIDELAATRRQQEAARNRQADLQLDLESAQDAARHAERELLQAQNEQASQRQRGEFARQQVQQLTQQRQVLEARQSELGQRLDARKADTSRLEEAFAAIDEKLRQQEMQVAEAALRQEQASKAIAGLNRSVDEHKSRTIDLMRQIARVHNDINGLKINQENLAAQKSRLEARKDQIETQVVELTARVAELETLKTELTGRSEELQQEAAEVRQRQQANNQVMAATSQELARQREQRSALKSRQAVLSDLQMRREGVSQAVRDILKERDSGKGAFGYVRGTLADAISTDLEHAGIIEAALGDLQHALIVSDSAAMRADAQRWRSVAGRVTLLPADGTLSFTPPPPGTWADRASPVLNLLSIEPQHALLVHQLLAHTFIVETLADAWALARESPRDFRFVTRAGEVVESSACGQPTLVLGDITRKSGAITRRAEVARLDQELARIEQVVQELTTRISQCDQTSRQLDARQQELRQQVYAADSRRAEVNAQLQQSASQLQRTTAEAPLLAGEIESVDRQAAGAAQRQAELEVQAAALEDEQKKIEAIVHDLGSQLIVRQHEVAELAEASAAARVAMGQVQEQRSGLSRELAAARTAVNQTQQELQRLDGDVQAIAARIGDAHAAIADTEMRLEALAGRCATMRQEVDCHSGRVTALKGESAALARQLEDLQAQVEEYARREHELSLAKNELSVRIETLIEHTMEELQINLHDAYAADLQNRNTREPNPTDWDAVVAEINELKGKISRLGNVNLDAITEQSQLEERRASLHAQLTDVAEAKRQLEELIGKINEDSRQRFAETFAAVRSEFHEMFRRLFGGGKAELILENPDDVLESGIEIMVRPPGKEPQSMSLLSGGEKTMTAVALVMSIFKSKPSPFCILDEVDAALDEANTTRFAAIIQDFLAHSQFIIITHNKRTMAVADTLYGVTMQEQGVSKRVAVKFDNKGNASVGSTLGGAAPAAEHAAA